MPSIDVFNKEPNLSHSRFRPNGAWHYCDAIGVLGATGVVAAVALNRALSPLSRPPLEEEEKQSVARSVVISLQSRGGLILTLSW